MLAGRSGVSALTQEWAAQLPVRIAAQLAVDRPSHRPGPGPPAGPVRADRAGRRPRGVGRRRPGRLGARPGAARASCVGTGIGGALTLLDQDDILEASGPRRVVAAHRTDAHAERAGRAVGLELKAQAGVHAPASACATGAEAIALGPGHDPVRPGRRGRRRRHRGGHPPAADRRLRRDARHVDPQRRAGEGVPAVRQGPRRLRARRGRGHRSCWNGPTTPRPAAPGSTPGWPAPA